MGILLFEDLLKYYSSSLLANPVGVAVANGIAAGLVKSSNDIQMMVSTQAAYNSIGKKVGLKKVSRSNLLTDYGLGIHRWNHFVSTR